MTAVSAEPPETAAQPEHHQHYQQTIQNNKKAKTNNTCSECQFFFRFSLWLLFDAPQFSLTINKDRNEKESTYPHLYVYAHYYCCDSAGKVLDTESRPEKPAYLQMHTRTNIRPEDVKYAHVYLPSTLLAEI